MPCSPGTWMTCTRKQSCQWIIPSAPPDILDLGPDVYPLLDGPVGSCYPCSAAANTLHYSYTGSNQYSLVDGSREWSCAGLVYFIISL